jgi:hypothetical protein
LFGKAHKRDMRVSPDELDNHRLVPTLSHY